MNRFWGIDPLAPEGKLCSFRFVDLRRSGQLSLVVAYDDGGGWYECNMVSVFDKGAAVEEYEAPFPPADGGYDVAHIVRDVNGDGRFELVVDDVLAREGSTGPADTGGRRCAAWWSRVYAWTGSGYTDVSSRYPKYYERKLQSLKKRIAALDAAAARSEPPASDAPVSPVPREETPPSAFEMEGHWDEGHWSSGSEAEPQVTLELGPQEEASQEEAPQASPSASQSSEAARTLDPEDVDCIKAEASKMERFLGRSRDAGILDAIRWANSSDRDQREFATIILGDIATPEALEYERRLSRDSDSLVARFAKGELKSWRVAKPPPVFQRQMPAPR